MKRIMLTILASVMMLALSACGIVGVKFDSVPVFFVYYFTDWKLFKIKWLDYGVLILIGTGFLIN